MKTITLKSILLVTFLSLNLVTFAQDIVGFRIDVIGSRYSDQMYLFSNPICTRYFDNGWDGYKMMGTNPYSPSIYAVEPGGYFQVDAIPDYNDTYIAFKPGEDAKYTLSFYSENLRLYYKELYLLDLAENKTVDIINSGVTYTFNVSPTDPLIRFKVVTSLPVTEVPVVVDTVAAPVNPETTPTDSVVVTPPTSTNDSVSTPVVTEPTDNGNIDTTQGQKSEKKISVVVANKNIIINNKGKGKYCAKVYNARTGNQVYTIDCKAEGATVFKPNLPAGNYIIHIQTATEEFSVNVLL